MPSLKAALESLDIQDFLPTVVPQAHPELIRWFPGASPATLGRFAAATPK